VTAKSCKNSEFLAGGTSANDPFDTAKIFSTPSFWRYAVWTKPFDTLVPATFAVKPLTIFRSILAHDLPEGIRPQRSDAHYSLRGSMMFSCECALVRAGCKEKPAIAAGFSTLRASAAINSDTPLVPQTGMQVHRAEG